MKKIILFLVLLVFVLSCPTQAQTTQPEQIVVNVNDLTPQQLQKN